MNKWTTWLVVALPVAMIACQPKTDHNGTTTDTTAVPLTDTTTAVASTQTESKEITAGKHKVTVSFTSRQHNDKSPETIVTVNANGQEILQKKYDAIFSFLDAATFQQTNPIPKDKSILLACGGEYIEIGSFLYVKEEKGGLAVYELLTQPTDDHKDTPTLLKTIK